MPVYKMTIDATTLWFDTGLNLDGTLPVTITATGQWTANPANGLVDANGHPELAAKSGYNLPGSSEGLLVGQVGTSEVFSIGTSGTVPAGLKGELVLSINDDMYKEYGAGFPDNLGSLELEIKVG